LHVTGAEVDWSAFFDGTGARRIDLPTYPFQRARYWVDAAGSTATVSALRAEDIRPETSNEDVAELRRSLSGLAHGERERLLLELVRTHVAGVLGHPSIASVEPDTAFRELGFDSLAAVELRRSLMAATGSDLPTTLVFDHPTPRAAAAHLAECLVSGPTAADSSVLAELARMEAVLASVEGDKATLDGVTQRLEAIVRRWQDGRRASAAAPKTDRGSTDFATATDDELFDALDNEFGIS
ncbi:phosphopantetheine-binding protein, partial [Streptomyces meridianus]